MTDPHRAWLRDCWYVIAWDHEIPAADAPRDVPLFRRIVLEEPILVYRLHEGGFAAMEDRCCHRHAPLSQGRREGDCVRCGYHGLMFDARGRCVDAPGLAAIPPKACVRSYPVAVRNRWVFVWMGDPERADPALLPDNFSCDHPDWIHRPGYLHYDAPYLLICDNLLDFSHLSYVHESSLGGTTKIAHSRPDLAPVPGPTPEWPQIGIRVTRHVPDVPAPPYYQRFRRFDTNLDRWFDYEFLLPGTLLMHSGGRPTGDVSGANEVRLHSCQTLTPETATTTHYFFQQAHPADLGDASTTASIHDSLLRAFEEDRAMLAAQHRNIALAPDAPMLPLAMDAALLQFRRLLGQRLAIEQARQDPPSTPRASTSRDPA